VQKLLIAAAASALFAGSAIAAPVSVTATNDVATLTSALLASGSNINITSSNLISGQPSQQGTHTGVNFKPSGGSGPTVTLGAGVVLSSGRADIGGVNTVNETSVNTGSGAYAALSTLAGTTTLNSNVLEYSFTVTGGANAIQLDFVFGTEEFPTQSVTDIFGVFVDGVNYARFPGGELISNTPGNPTNFISNPVGAGLYETQYNGFTRTLSLIGLLDASLTSHRIVIGIADTSDTRYDSGVYVSNLRAISTTGGGGINPGTVPTPGSLALAAIALMGAAGFSRRKAQRS
jgi:hypothetical protein